jgi:hypothetical protein
VSPKQGGIKGVLSANASNQEAIKSVVTDDLKDNTHAMPIFSRLSRSNLYNGFGTTDIISGLERTNSTKKLMYNNYKKFEKSQRRFV